ncbi:tRNA lysidine(34) synthetase TilS [Mucilaginibacter arboris]|uniref:tRNA(Ile)-lysidine synthase n=1 Tax=Mucilaginibacter arboris TaxID=2682090 RepID=A0A7K1SXL4_9SPHI|nr:tRNA lysidine(34) synthetase TilS [Mucilaginibacter arboris]MVN22069.1 tRNA lysidine(34) synthetase TilS [Mucilaginibacter arboris]
MLPVLPFQEFIARHALFTKQKKVLAAVSGGKDSVLLAHLLKSSGFDFAIAHCNFQLRGAEAKRDQDFTSNLADQLQVPFFLTEFNTNAYAAKNHISTQMAARELRYNWFEKICAEENFDVIALAHHQNDSVETILLNLTRGTGIAGMHGILSKNGKLVRPMLFLSRENIDEICAEEKLDFVEDSSNASVKYARNKIRLEVVPKLKELNPNLEKTFEQNLEHFRQLEQLLENQLQHLRDTVFIRQKLELRIRISDLKNLNPQKLLLFGLLREFNFSEQIVNDLLLSLEKHSGKIFESPSHQLVLDRTEIIIQPKKTPIKEVLLIAENQNEVNFQGFKLKLLHDETALIVKNNPMATSVAAEKLIFPLTLRNWQAGDYFFPLGMQNKQKLSDFFIHQKVPLHQKSVIPVLVNGNQEIIWIAGYRLDDRYKVQKGTKKVIIFELSNQII